MLRKVIRLTLTLLDGEVFIEAKDNNRISSKGLAVSCVITQGNGAMSPTAQITVYGLPIETMNKLFRVQWNTMQSILNTVKIEAGEGSDLDIVYEGNITFATVNMAAAPNVSLVITSQMAIVDKMKYSAPFTIPKGESADIADIIQFLAKESGYELTNNGVSRILTDTTLNGSNIEKITKLSQICEFDLYVEQRSITICKKGTARELKIPVITPTTGLIRYPSPDIRGVNFSCIYDPLVRFGGIVTIADSEIEICNTDWRIYGLVTTLEANILNGKWESSVSATWRDSKDAAVQR